MDGNGSYRLHRTGKSEVLAESEHGFQAGIGVWGKIHAGQQLAAVGGRVFHRRREPFAALAKGSCLSGCHEAGFEFGGGAGAVRDDDQGPVLKPAQQGPVGGRAERPGPVVLLGAAGARLSGQPLHDFIESVEGEVDDGAGADANILTQGGQIGHAHGLDPVTAGHEG